MKLAHLEQLHASLPQLENLDLRAYLYNDDNGIESDEELVSQAESVAGCIKKLNISAGRINQTGDDINPSYQSSVQTWVLYIGKKYPNVEHFELHGCKLAYSILWNNGLFQKNLVGAEKSLVGLKHMNTYRVPYMTCGIIQVFEGNDVNLNEVSLSLVNCHSMQLALQNLVQAKSIKTLQRLDIDYVHYALENEDYVDCGSDLGTFLLSSNLIYLTQITVHHGEVNLLVDILQNCSSQVKELNYELVFVSNRQKLQNVNNTLKNMSVIKPSSIKILLIRLTSERTTNGELESDVHGSSRLNGILQFALDSCHLLETFSIDDDGDFFDSLWKQTCICMINLTFSSHDRLTNVFVYLVGRRYYETYNLVDGVKKQWVLYSKNNNKEYQPDGEEDYSGKYYSEENYSGKDYSEENYSEENYSEENYIEEDYSSEEDGKRRDDDTYFYASIRWIKEPTRLILGFYKDDYYEMDIDEDSHFSSKPF